MTQIVQDKTGSPAGFYEFMNKREHHEYFADSL